MVYLYDLAADVTGISLSLYLNEKDFEPFHFYLSKGISNHLSTTGIIFTECLVNNN
jgi:hypothetical protein